MANINAPFGFTVSRHASGGVSARVNEYDIASGLAQNIFEGDLVGSVGDGTITKKVAGNTSSTIGVFKGVQYTAATGEIVYSNKWVSGTTTSGSAAAKALVHDDPNTLFLVQADSTFAAADIGLFANVSIPNPAGNTVTGRSRAALSTPDSTETDVKIIRAVAQPNRSDSGSGFSVVGPYAIVEVKLNNHELAGATPSLEV